MKKNVIWIMVFFMVVIVVIMFGGKQMKNKSSVRFDEEPIYNHFPSLPNAKEMQWCSSSTSGIGLTTTKIYIFAFYETDIENILLNNQIEPKYTETSIAPPFLPEILKEETKGWKKAKDSHFLFQDGIAEFKKMNTNVYLNTKWNVIYMEAIGD